MKKLFVSLVALTFAITTFANQGTLVEKMSNKTTLNRISRYLDTDSDQKRDLEYIFSLAQKEYKKALNAGLDQEIAGQKALNFSLANSRAILAREQYNKLLLVLNTTINNEARVHEDLLASN